MAGFRELLAVEWDDHAVQCFKLNFPAVPVYHGDIAVLSVEECLALAGVNPGELDVLDGSPPCQGFSTLGKRQLDDPRNSLFREFVRLLDGLQPRVFVMENVPGMVKGKMKLVFAEALVALKSCGYNTVARILNAANYGVPQARERLIILGVRDGTPPLPRPTGKPPITAAEALVGVVNQTWPPPFRPFGRDLWRKQQPGDSGFGDIFFNHVKLAPDRPCPTIPKSTVFGGYSGMSHWSEPRALTAEELARLSSFPDAYRWTGDYADRVARIGNSVPPLFMKAIAETLRREVLSHGNA